MLTLTCALLLSATPGVGLTLSAELGRAETPQRLGVLDAIEGELVAAGLPVRRLSARCDGQRECLVRLGRDNALAGVVGVTLAWAKKKVTVDLEGLRVKDSAAVAQRTFTAPGRLGPPELAEVRAFAAQVATALQDAPVVVPDTPVAETPGPSLVPDEKPVEPVQVAVTAAPRSNVPAYVMGGGAVAGGIVAGVFLGLATSNRNTLMKTPDPSPLTRDQANQLAADANRDYSVSLAAGIAAGALATGAVVWLLTK